MEGESIIKIDRTPSIHLPMTLLLSPLSQIEPKLFSLVFSPSNCLLPVTGNALDCQQTLITEPD